MEEVSREIKIKALFGVAALLIAAFAVALSIHYGKVSYAINGAGLGVMVYGYGLSPRFFLSKISYNKSNFTKASSNVVLVGCFILIIGFLFKYVP